MFVSDHQSGVCLNASDRQRINSVIDRARRLGYCSPDTSTFDELCDTADDELFGKAVRLSNHDCTHYYHHHPPPHNAITVCTPYMVAQNKIPHWRICNISATGGLNLKILEAT